MRNPDYPALSYLFTGYFHEDFDEQGEWPQVIDYFAERNPQEIAATLDEFDRLLATDLSDDELDAVVESCGSVYYVESGEVREWIVGLRARLAERSV